MKSFIFLLSLFAVDSVFSQTCTPPPPRRVPVIDQDGISTCASASAAVLIQLNVEDENGRLGLARTPSYLQMSIYSAARSSQPGFFKTGPAGNEFFSAYQHVCSVVDTAMGQGFCDSDNFPLDFLGEDDAFRSQQRSLEMIGNYLQSNTSGLEQFRQSLRENPERTKDLLAHLYQRQASVCGRNPKEMIVRNAWLRRKAAWTAQLARTTNPNQRRVLNTLLTRTFGPDGQPTAAAMEFGLDDLFERSMSAMTTPDRIATIGEGMLSVHWAIRLDLEMQGFLNEGVNDNGIQEDHRRTQYCQWPMLMALQEYLRDPNCPIPRDVSIPEDVRNSVEAVTRVVNRQDLRASIVGLMSPACADQAARRRIANLSCRESEVNPTNARAQKDELFRDLCASRAVSLTVCQGFMRLTGPVNSANCTRPIPGASGNDYHAITAIGMRNVGEKRQVLIQNSYGSRCSFADGNVLRPGFNGLVECELSPSGVPTGRFWIDEDLLFNNTIAMVTLRKS